MRRLTIYSRPGCHLCDQMKDVIAQVVAELPPGAIFVDEVDISTDSRLEAQYGHAVPVLLVDDRLAAQYRVTPRALKAAVLE